MSLWKKYWLQRKYTNINKEQWSALWSCYTCKEVTNNEKIMEWMQKYPQSMLELLSDELSRQRLRANSYEALWYKNCELGIYDSAELFISARDGVEVYGLGSIMYRLQPLMQFLGIDANIEELGYQWIEWYPGHEPDFFEVPYYRHYRSMDAYITQCQHIIELMDNGVPYELLAEQWKGGAVAPQEEIPLQW